MGYDFARTHTHTRTVRLFVSSLSSLLLNTCTRFHRITATATAAAALAAPTTASHCCVYCTCNLFVNSEFALSLRTLVACLFIRAQDTVYANGAAVAVAAAAVARARDTEHKEGGLRVCNNE